MAVTTSDPAAVSTSPTVNARAAVDWLRGSVTSATDVMVGAELLGATVTVNVASTNCPSPSVARTVIVSDPNCSGSKSSHNVPEAWSTNTARYNAGLARLGTV